MSANTGIAWRCYPKKHVEIGGGGFTMMISYTGGSKLNWNLWDNRGDHLLGDGKWAVEEIPEIGPEFSEMPPLVVAEIKDIGERYLAGEKWCTECKIVVKRYAGSEYAGRYCSRCWRGITRLSGFGHYD